MFIALIQAIDVFAWGLVAVQLFLVFYILTWLVLGVRLFASSRYENTHSTENTVPGISVIVPVYNESAPVFDKVLERLYLALDEVKVPSEVFVIENGTHNLEGTTLSHGYTYIHQGKASKRLAIATGVEKAQYPVTILLDSDTIATRDSIKLLLRSFSDESVGGVVPRQEVYRRTATLMNRLCDWYEEIRFGNTTPGLSAVGSIPCLIGRLYAVRTKPLKKYMPEFVSQYLFGDRLETGDDRVITSMLLKQGYKTVYDRDALVYTLAPQTLGGFAKQRLRWSRSSFRETLLSPWLVEHPYALFIMWADIVLRWLFALVIAGFVITLISGSLAEHAIALPWYGYVLGGAIGFFVSGWLKQIPHLLRRPDDHLYTPLFLLLTTFVLTPVEWYGNLTFWKGGGEKWLTRNISNN